MAIVTINIPDTEKNDLYSFVNERGGEIIDQKESKDKVDFSENDDNDEVTHGEFFGENIRRAINILKKR